MLSRFRVWLRRRSDAAFARACPTAAWVSRFETPEDLFRAVELVAAGVDEAHEGKVSPVDWSVFDVD